MPTHNHVDNKQARVVDADTAHMAGLEHEARMLNPSETLRWGGWKIGGARLGGSDVRKVTALHDHDACIGSCIGLQ